MGVGRAVMQRMKNVCGIIWNASNMKLACRVLPDTFRTLSFTI